MSFGAAASSAMGDMSNAMGAMMPVMEQAGQDQVDMSMVQSVLNIAKTAASDCEDASKKG